MKQNNHFWQFTILFGLLLFSAHFVKAQQAEDTVSDIFYQRLQVFPEGRLGNAIYNNNFVWLYSKENLIVHDGIYFPAIDTNVFLIEDNGVTDLLAYPLSRSNLIEINSKSLARIDIQNRKVVIFALPTNKLAVFEFAFNSARGFVANQEDYLAFYHLAKIEEDPIIQLTNYQYRLHVYNSQADSLRTLPYVLETNYPITSLAWQGKSLAVTYANNQQQLFAAF